MVSALLGIVRNKGGTILFIGRNVEIGAIDSKDVNFLLKDRKRQGKALSFSLPFA
jgi:hypothetical protein